MDFIIFFSIVPWMTKVTIALVIPTVGKDKDEYIKCAEAIIKEFECKSLTFVNFDDDVKLAKNLHNSIKYEIIQRHYLGLEMNIPNEAYAVMCKNIEDCDEGLDDLIKDRYWNPNTTFLIIMEKTMKSHDNEKLFEKLHRLYVFKTVILNNGNFYLYNFNIGNHCDFSPRAILNYQCKRLYNSYSGFRIIKQSLKELKTIPYSGCSLRIRINVIKPYIFPPVNYNDTPVGFEEEFAKILISNFPNATYEYDMENNIIGYVSPNFTTTNTLKDIQDNVIDGVVGATILSYNRLSVFDFTNTHIHHDLVLTIPTAVKVEKWKVMLTLIKPLLWALILVTLFLISLLTFAFKNIDSFQFQIFNATTFDASKYFIFVASKRTASCFILLWVLVTSYIEVFYQSSLASVFAKPVFYKQINSLEELVQEKYKFHLYRHLKNYAHDTNELDLNALVNAGTKMCETHSACLSIVAEGGKNYVLMSRLIVEYYEPKYQGKNGEGKLFVVQEPYQHLLMTTYLKKGNPNLKRTRFLERQAIASGLPRRAMAMLIHENKLKYFKFQSEHTEVVTCRDIEGLYYLLLIGCGWISSKQYS